MGRLWHGSSSCRGLARRRTPASLGGSPVPSEAHASPLSESDRSTTRSLDQVRSAIATGDRQGALKLLRAHVEGELDLSTVPATVADALVETARGVDRAEKPESAPPSRAGVQQA